MYRLVNDLARERLLYLRVQVTLPDIMLIDVTVRFAHTSLPLGRYYPILLETEAEHRELERYLNASRTAPIRPDLFDRRRSALVAPCITLAQYPPPLPGWPWLLLCHWPPSHTALTDDPDMFARGAYRVAWRRPQRRDDFGTAVRNGRSDEAPAGQGGFGESTAGMDGGLAATSTDLEDVVPF